MRSNTLAINQYGFSGRPVSPDGRLNVNRTVAAAGGHTTVDRVKDAASILETIGARDAISVVARPEIKFIFIMIPIQDLLHRIQWDPSFADGDFEISYYDRVEERIIRVPMSSVRFDKDTGFALELFDQEGAVHMIPLHRVREVYKNGRRIWSRSALRKIRKKRGDSEKPRGI